MFNFKGKRNRGGGGGRSKASRADTIEKWTRECFSKIIDEYDKKTEAPVITKDTVISISEIKCQEPDCPPLETVLAVLCAERPLRISIRKSIAEVQKVDVVAAFTSWCKGEAPICNCADILLRGFALDASRQKTPRVELVGSSVSAEAVPSVPLSMESTMNDVDRMIDSKIKQLGNDF